MGTQQAADTCNDLSHQRGAMKNSRKNQHPFFLVNIHVDCEISLKISPFVVGWEVGQIIWMHSDGYGKTRANIIKYTGDASPMGV